MVHSRTACSKAWTSNALGPSAASLRKAIRFSEARLQAVSSRNMYSEHGLEARMSPPFGQVCQSLMVVWNWMPGSAQAHAAWEIFSHSSRAFIRLCSFLSLRRVRSDGAQEIIRHPHRVVRVLAGHRHIGFGIPIGVVGAEIDPVVALLREGNDALDVIVGNVGFACRSDLALQRRIEGRIEAIIAR